MAKQIQIRPISTGLILKKSYENYTIYIELKCEILFTFYFYIMKIKKKILIPFCFLFFAACSDSEDIKKFPDLEDLYDPSKPKEVVSMSPLVGRVDDNFVLEGNFGNDISKMRVYFGERKAVLLKTNGQTLHGIVPKQPAGDNPITVVLENDSIVTDIKFRYRQFQNVITVAGNWENRQNWWQGDFKDGTLDQATFTYILGVTVVAGGNLIVGETWYGRLRFVSIEDNEVVRISGDWGPSFNQGATTSTRETAYFVESGGSHRLFRLDRSNAWEPVQIRNSIPELTGEVHAPTFAGDDRYIYLRDNQGNFGRLDIENKADDYPFELLMSYANGNGEGLNKLCYSKFSDCFYATSPAEHGIYKIWEDKATQQWKIERYAGFNGTGYSEGDRLTDAKFNFPVGICADNYGNVFVTSQSNNTIFKIWLQTGRVEHVAGKYTDGWVEKPLIVGKPLESQFQQPSSIAMDEEENFFIPSQEGGEIHKYSIE